MRRNDGSEFDQHLVRRFSQLVGVYPVGNLVKLNTNEIAVVLSTHAPTPIGRSPHRHRSPWRACHPAYRREPLGGAGRGRNGSGHRRSGRSGRSRHRSADTAITELCVESCPLCLGGRPVRARDGRRHRAEAGRRGRRRPDARRLRRAIPRQLVVRASPARRRWRVVHARRISLPHDRDLRRPRHDFNGCLSAQARHLRERLVRPRSCRGHPLHRRSAARWFHTARKGTAGRARASCSFRRSRIQMRLQGAHVVTLALKARSAIMLAGHGGDAVTWISDSLDGWDSSTVFTPAPIPAGQGIPRGKPDGRRLRQDAGRGFSRCPPTRMPTMAWRKRRSRDGHRPSRIC